MKLAILHLSDLHLRADRVNPVLGWAEELAAATTAEAMGLSSLLVVITGDIAYGGRPEEYAHASGLLRALSDALRSRGWAQIQILAVPGNHDCDFSECGSVRASLLGQSLADPDEEAIGELTKVQAAFREFAKQLCVVAPTADVLFTHDLEIGGVRVRAHLFNTAWMSSNPEKKGSLCMPIARVRGAIDRCGASSKSDLVVSILHHPYGWLNDQDARGLRALLGESSDIVLTGHEHETLAFQHAYADHVSVNYIEGGVLQGNPDSPDSTCNLVIVDLREKQLLVTSLSRQESSYQSSGAEAWRPFVRNQARMGSVFTHASSFSASLEDVGANLMHPRAQQVRLADVFVYPEVRDMALPGERSPGLHGDLLGYVMTAKRVVVVGRESAGKTAIAKRLCVDLLGAGIVPLLFSGGSFAPRNDRRFKSLLEEAVAEQYGKEQVRRYMGAEPVRRAIIIDDFHKVPLSPSRRDQLVSGLHRFAGIVLLTAREDLRLDYLNRAAGGEETSGLLEFRYVSILPLGFLKRHHLVKRWCWLGVDAAVADDQAVERSVQRMENSLNSVMATNVVPPVPIFVLILLQQLEAGSAHQVGPGSHGHMYGALILAAVGRATASHGEMDAWLGYLSDLAWIIRESGCIVEVDMQAWHEEYCELQLVDLDLKSGLRRLVSAGVLRKDAGFVRFAYDYMRQFFVARYLSRHLEEPRIREIVREMASKLHNEANAMVMLFLAHLSGGFGFVVEALLESADGLMRGVLEWDPDEGKEDINKLVAKVPSLMLMARPVEENRIEELRQLDEQTFLEAWDSSAADDPREGSLATQDDLDAEAAGRINGVFKTIQIIGQILRSYSGSFAGDRKLQLANVCYALGLKVLGLVVRSIGKHGDGLVKGLVQQLMRVRPEAARDRLEGYVGSFLFVLCEQCVFGVVRHVSQSLGHEEMARVFRRLKGDGTRSLGYALIDLSVQLDHFESVPVADAEKLYRSNAGNLLVRAVVQHLAWYHMYLFNTPYQVQQRLCENLGIERGPGLLGVRHKMFPRSPS